MTVNRGDNQMARRYRRHSVHEPVSCDPSPREISDMELMRELILGVFLGESGTIFHTDPGNDHRYTVVDGLKIDPPTRTHALRLSNIGWLYNRVKRYRNHLSQSPSYGSVAVAFSAALDEAMIEYNRLITTIGQELHDMNDPDYGHGSRANQRGIQGMPFVSLSRIEVWTLDWFYKLKALAVLIEKCKHKRGGALINVIYRESLHGDPMIRECFLRILVKVVEELKKLLSRWIFHGQIDDPYKEFFITNASQSQLAASSACSTGYNTPSTTTGPSKTASTSGPTSESVDSSWLEKFVINKDMLPGFIPQDQVKKILSTGTSVNLLLQSTPLTGSRLNLDPTGLTAELIPGLIALEESFEKTGSEILFRDTFSLICDDGNNNTSDGSVQPDSFAEILNKAHLETSLLAKKVLFEDHKLMNHLAGIRGFLLLGQGDFIRHFMESEKLNLVLNQRASVIKEGIHTIRKEWESSIDETNARFLDEDVRHRIDSIFLAPTVVDLDQFDQDTSQTTGWDVFTLTYRTEGPISAILTLSCMNDYSVLFKYLWRSKRMEIILSKLWMKYRSTSPQLKLFQGDPDLQKKLKIIFRQNSLIIHEMNHFIQQMAYYIGFEVLECSWEEFNQKLNAASDIESLVEAHRTFLTNVSVMSMLEPKNNRLFQELRGVYECITEYQSELKSFENKLSLEIERRERNHKLSSQESVTRVGSKNRGGDPGHGVQETITDEELALREEFESEVVSRFKAEMKMKSASYQEMVQSFLKLLAKHPDVNMKLLSTRIDFNKYYAKNDTDLSTSFHYSTRLSLDGSFKGVH